MVSTRDSVHTGSAASGHGSANHHPLSKEIGSSIITPFTKFSSIKDIMATSQLNCDKDDTFQNGGDLFYVRNITNEFSTHYYPFRSVIFEVIPDCDYIASITLFKV